MWLLKLLVVLVATYAAVVLIAYAAQTWLLFPASSAGGAIALPATAERITCKIPDGERLEGVRIPLAEATRADHTVVLGFGGNAWNAEHMASYLHGLYPFGRDRHLPLPWLRADYRKPQCCRAAQ